MEHRARPTAGRLAELASLGGYFEITPDDGTQSRCLTEFFSDAVLDGHVEATREAIARSAQAHPDDLPVRMAASSFQLGVAARLLSPVIGAAVCLPTAPVLDGRSVRWVPTEGHAPQFVIADCTWVPTEPTSAAALLSETVIPLLLALGDRLHARVSLSPQVTTGNISSAANGAVTVLAMSRPQHEDDGRALIRALLAAAPLAGTATVTAGRFRRHSCCLYYQGPGGGLCGDCVLTA